MFDAQKPSVTSLVIFSPLSSLPLNSWLQTGKAPSGERSLTSFYVDGVYGVRNVLYGTATISK